MKSAKTITTDKKRLAAAFDRWLEEWLKDPEAFEKLEDQRGGTYGEKCAAKLVRLLGVGR